MISWSKCNNGVDKIVIWLCQQEEKEKNVRKWRNRVRVWGSKAVSRNESRLGDWSSLPWSFHSCCSCNVNVSVQVLRMKAEGGSTLAPSGRPNWDCLTREMTWVTRYYVVTRDSVHCFYLPLFSHYISMISFYTSTREHYVSRSLHSYYGVGKVRILSHVMVSMLHILFFFILIVNNYWVVKWAGQHGTRYIHLRSVPCCAGMIRLSFRVMPTPSVARHSPFDIFNCDHALILTMYNIYKCKRVRINNP